MGNRPSTEPLQPTTNNAGCEPPVRLYELPSPPLPSMPEKSPPSNGETSRQAIIREVAICATHMDNVSKHGSTVVEAVDQLLREPYETNLTQDGMIAACGKCIDIIKEHDEASTTSVPRCLKALEWCRSDGRAEKVPEADAECDRLRLSLVSYEEVLVNQLGPRMSICKRIGGETPSFTGILNMMTEEKKKL